ncbi:hypothetical protein ACEYW6_12505 [Nostoc sp. UIC 10607]
MACKLLELNTEDGSNILVANELPNVPVGRVTATSKFFKEK